MLIIKKYIGESWKLRYSSLL